LKRPKAIKNASSESTGNHYKQYSPLEIAEL
jgi:hypothetical protein